MAYKGKPTFTLTFAFTWTYIIHCFICDAMHILTFWWPWRMLWNSILIKVHICVVTYLCFLIVEDYCNHKWWQSLRLIILVFPTATKMVLSNLCILFNVTSIASSIIATSEITLSHIMTLNSSCLFEREYEKCKKSKYILYWFSHTS